jgi:hypothetical protein
MSDSEREASEPEYSGFRRELWGAAHQMAMIAEHEPERIAELTRRLYDVALSESRSG